MLTAISLYTGVGGLDFGFEAAGFRIAVAIEIDPTACRTIRLNRSWPVMEGDIQSLSSEAILVKAGLKAGQADVLIGGPPCQPYSKSSYWVSGDSARLDDPRSNTLVSYLRVLRDTRPRAFLLENVHGLAYNGKDEGLRYLVEGIEGVNRQAGTRYSIHWGILNAAGFGVPQFRERVFLIGSRDGALFNFPDYTHEDSNGADVLFASREPYRTAWDALSDLPSNPNDPSLRIGGKWGDLLPTIPEGQNYLWHTRKGGGLPLFGWRTRYWSFLLKLSKRRPSWTIQAQPGSAIGPFHWTSRKLSGKEMCRLQTFPDGLVFDCGRTEIQRMLGNAVPSLVTEVLAWQIRRQLFSDEKRQSALELLPPRQTQMPPPEKVAEVPSKYLCLVGDHADHPGEGLGVRGRRQSQSQDYSDTEFAEKAV